VLVQHIRPNPTGKRELYGIANAPSTRVGVTPCALPQ
jgi:hypothetical protein